LNLLLSTGGNAWLVVLAGGVGANPITLEIFSWEKAKFHSNVNNNQRQKSYGVFKKET
jgi:hypothetical protein